MPPTTRTDAAPSYLLEGDETYLRDLRAEQLIAELTPSDNVDYNIDVVQGSDVDLDEVVAACNTWPMMADRRLVVIRGLDLVIAAAHKGFRAYLDSPNPTTALIVTAASAGSRGKELTSLRKALGRREEFGALRDDRARDYVRESAKRRGVAISSEAVRLLVEVVGTDAGRLDSEVEKASLLVGEGAIETEHVEALAWRTRSHTMFELTDAIATGDRQGVLEHLDALISDGAEPVALIGMVGWHFRRTLRGAAAAEGGAQPAEIARAGAVRGPAVGRFAKTCQRLGTRGAARALRAMQVVDRRLKSTPENRRQVLERTLLELLADN